MSTATIARFEDTALPSCDLLNGRFALPFCPSPHLPALWARIVAAIGPAEERDDPPDVREPKHWHLVHVVARKR